MGFFLPCPISSAKSRLRDFFRLLAIGICHFLPVHHFGMAYLPGSMVKIQQTDQEKEKLRNYRSTSMTYSSGQGPYPAKCRSMVFCSIWKKFDKTKRKERCLSLLWTNDCGRLLSPPKTWFYVNYPAWA